MSIDVVAVVGAGTMGGGIAQMFAENGLSTYLWDKNAELTKHSIETIGKRLEKSVEKGAMTAEAARLCMSKLQPCEELSQLAKADLIVEAIFEDLEAKQALFAQLENILEPRTLIASNTSSLSISELAASFKHPERFLGLHFFNPPTKLALLEVVSTESFDAARLPEIKQLLLKCGKQPVEVKDSPGFIVNRLLLPLINEAARLLDAEVAEVSDIDAAMRLGALHPAGPLQVADLIGLDICCDILRKLASSLNNEHFLPAKALTDRVAEGKLGRKSGSGFYNYLK